MKTHVDYVPPRRKPMTGWGCLAWMLLALASFSISTVLVLFVGSLISHITHWRSPLLMLLSGILIALLPVLILNGSLTWLRQRWNQKARFRDTFAHLTLLCNTSMVLAFVVAIPGDTSKALKLHGQWPFGQEVANLLQIDKKHIALRTGRRWVRRMAYLLELESENPTLALTQRPNPNTTKHLPPTTHTTPPDTTPTTPPDTTTTTPPNPQDNIPLGRRILQPLRSLLSPRHTPPPFRFPPNRIPNDHNTPKLLPAQPHKTPQAIRLRFEKQGNALIVPAKLHGLKTKLLLDTGASFLTLSRSTMRRLGISLPYDSPTLTLQTANGRLRAPVGLLSQFSLGGYKLHNVTFVLCNACADSQRSISGLLGLNVLRRFLFTLDHHTGQIILNPQPHRKNQAADIRPFLKYPQLKGRTTQLLLRRTFSLRGTIKNHAPMGIRKLKLRVLYLKDKRTISSRLFSLHPLQGGARRRFAYTDRKAPRFDKYRIELVYGEWFSSSNPF